jgi:hypothetical protein
MTHAVFHAREISGGLTPEWPGSRTPSIRRPHFTTVFKQSRYGVIRHEAAEA